MAAVSGENLDLYDVRKTQRRLKVLINVNDVDSPQRYPVSRFFYQSQKVNDYC